MAIYKIDPAHSEIQFKIRHLMITNVTGSFAKFSGTLESDKDDFSDAEISFEADVNSVTTNNEQRDGHLKSADFFNAEKYPEIKFKSTGFIKKNDEDYKLTGNLTLKDITKPVELDVTFGGAANDMYGQSKAGFEVSGKISRKDFNIAWGSEANETGTIVLGDDVKLLFNVQLVKQA